MAISGNQSGRRGYFILFVNHEQRASVRVRSSTGHSCSFAASRRCMMAHGAVIGLLIFSAKGPRELPAVVNYSPYHIWLRTRFAVVLQAPGTEVNMLLML